MIETGYFDREKTSKRSTRILRELEFPMGVLESELRRNGNGWLMGRRFTVADLNVASVVYWVHFQGRKRREHILSKVPNVRKWLEKCMSRRFSPLAVLSETSVSTWKWEILQEGASRRSSRAGNVSFKSKL